MRVERKIDYTNMLKMLIQIALKAVGKEKDEEYPREKFLAKEEISPNEEDDFHYSTEEGSINSV